jgi:hypothetical protein
MPSSEPANLEGRRPTGPTLRGAVLGAVVGAALFLGMGAALPVWTTMERAPAEEDSPPGLHLMAWQPAKVTLWSAIRTRMLSPFLFEPSGHLRGPGPHCRGCHVVDAVLARS